MAETFEDLATLEKFSKTYPRAFWSPEMFNKYNSVYNIYLHIDLDSIEGRGISITAAKACAIRMYNSIISSEKMSNNKNEIDKSENMTNNYATSGNTSHFAEDTQLSDCSKNAESTLSSTETLDHID
ncbi:uncharacterized protein LOC103309474 [Acyrthosiphon pisum]|uniref:Uncharacterized protein n=1 Tax=Acyrthosiphon pisum TaxID=7029 RepID=A0A8R2B5X2_ACYPI|nr:uncharacterized protein LOC103309474 [Acyrthosiphon pisum]|eukprot:XP_008183204.2 PREDICTED: uncharacterized protein LOC103309474 [Acyrthosiphon pisum]